MNRNVVWSTRSVRRRQSVSKTKQRNRSKVADVALQLFGDLRRYFPSDRLLAEALGWDVATVAAWRTGQVVRPQKAKVVEAFCLRELCEEVRAYLTNDSDVARWITAPQPQLALGGLKGLTPARYLRARGRQGLDELTGMLVAWMPVVPERNLEPVEDAAIDSDDPAVREFGRMLAELG